MKTNNFTVAILIMMLSVCFSIPYSYAQTIEQEGTKQTAVPPKQAIKYKLTFPQGTTYIEMFADYGTFSNSYNKSITYAPEANNTSFSLFENADAFLIDDIHLFKGKDGLQHELFILFNKH